MQKITLKDLKEKKACTEGLEYFEKMYGEECAIAEFIKTKHKIDYVIWLIMGCEYCQTPEFIKYLKTLNPTSDDVCWLISKCDYCQTPEFIKYLKTLNPTSDYVCWLISKCDYCQTPEIKEMLMEGLK